MDIMDFEMTGPIIIAIVFAVAFIIFAIYGNVIMGVKAMLGVGGCGGGCLWLSK